MGKNAILKMYQTARFMEWIGNFDEAEAIYNKIEQSEQVLSNVMLPTIISKKKKLETMKDNKWLQQELEIVIRKQQKTQLLFKKENIKTKKTIFREIFENTSILWDYSITVLSKVDTDLRLEIKGFNLTEMKPNLDFNNEDILSDWSFTEIKSEPTKDKRDIIWFTAINKEYHSELFLSIDRWGLLNGTIIVSENSLGDTLSEVHLLLSDLSRRVWML